VSEKRRPGRVEVAEMFDRIAPEYDKLNRILSVGTDDRWRRKAIKAGNVSNGEAWLDLAAGSGDVAKAGLEYASESNWIAADPSIELLKILAKRKELKSVTPVLSAAEALPFDDEVFNGVTVSFGLRNFEDRMLGLSEIYRVLNLDGRVVIIEFLARKKGSWGGGPFVRLYLEKILPWLGGLISGDNTAYKYLAHSSQTFWTVEELKTNLQKVGFKEVISKVWMGGAVTMTVAYKSTR
jgi:demethylmenaquinone methyltransferase / 2-methoxy-6-polyprenyl-1,4-benzoquinol methylase